MWLGEGQQLLHRVLVGLLEDVVGFLVELLAPFFQLVVEPESSLLCAVRESLPFFFLLTKSFTKFAHRDLLGRAERLKQRLFADGTQQRHLAALLFKN